ncbi:MAG: tRNA epoxyqueuosine(34) reductase QueG [Prevotellaceae bacterium]|nr:tRNA epoxyqueuosine(34) reductase QueG [Prevotellaceae bacterium]
MLTSELIQSAARAAGFDACGAVALSALPDDVLRSFDEWIRRRYHAGMRYMERHAQKRADPRLLMKSGARTAVVTLFSYKPQRRQPPHLPQVSCYAYGTDYHETLKQKLWRLLATLQATQPTLRGRTLVDTAPLQERYWAAAAGLGWRGKNGMLISQELGSYTFIGVLLLSQEVACSAKPQPNRCGACTRCISACPTGAIVGNGSINARRCLSYSTIEKYANPLNDDAANAAKDEKTAGYIFGCDICQEVCPWNKNAKVAAHGEMQMLPQLLTLTAEDWLAMSAEDFEKIFGHSPIKRATLHGMKENVRRMKKLKIEN